MNTILGKKITQTQGFLENGSRIPLTFIAASDNIVMGQKTYQNFSAVQLGFGKRKKTTKALLGIAKAAHLSDAPQVIREAKADGEMAVGDAVKVEEVFQPGDIVSVTGQSKGKGFAGGVKRYHFKGGPRTHGQSDRERAPGSIGQTTTPGRVYKGKRMAGNMGDEQVTVSNLLVVDVDAANKQLILKGLVPGVKGSIVTITKTGAMKEKNFVPLFSLAEPEPAIEETVEEPVPEVAPEVTEAQPAEQPAAEEPVAETREEEKTKEERNG